MKFIGFLRKIQFSVWNILMKNLFWKESETNWIEIYIQFLQSILKKIRKPSLLPITTELRKSQKLRMNFKIFKIFKIFFQLTQ